MDNAKKFIISYMITVSEIKERTKLVGQIHGNDHVLTKAQRKVSLFRVLSLVNLKIIGCVYGSLVAFVCVPFPVYPFWSAFLLAYDCLCVWLSWCLLFVDHILFFPSVFFCLVEQPFLSFR